jgi:ABC-type transport system substrate-binding protein
VNLKTEDWGQYIGDLYAGKFPVFMFGWTPDFIDGSLLENWFLDAPLGSGAASLAGGFSNAEVNDLLLKARSITDQAERVRLYQRVAVIVNETVAGVPIVHTSVPNIFTNKVQGFVPVPLKTDIMRGVRLVP